MTVFPVDGICGVKATRASIMKQMEPIKSLLRRLGLQRRRKCTIKIFTKSTELCTLYFILQQRGHSLHIALYFILQERGHNLHIMIYNITEGPQYVYCIVCISGLLIVHGGKNNFQNHQETHSDNSC